MNNWAHAQNDQNGQASRRVAASIFGGKRLRANGKTFTQTTFARKHTHTYIRNYIWRWSWLLWLLEKSFIENDEHAHNPTNGLAIYISICVYVYVMCVCVSRSLLVFWLAVSQASWLHAWAFCALSALSMLFSYPKYIFVLSQRIVVKYYDPIESVSLWLCPLTHTTRAYVCVSVCVRH